MTGICAGQRPFSGNGAQHRTALHDGWLPHFLPHAEPYTSTGDTMTTTTALSISRAARVGASLLDAAASAGLPTNVSLTAHIDYDGTARLHREAARFQFYDDDFSDVQAWAAWLGVQAIERPGHEPEVTFCDAETTVDGVHVKLTGNRRS